MSGPHPCALTPIPIPNLSGPCPCTPTENELHRFTLQHPSPTCQILIPALQCTLPMNNNPQWRHHSRRITPVPPILKPKLSGPHPYAPKPMHADQERTPTDSPYDAHPQTQLDKSSSLHPDARCPGTTTHQGYATPTYMHPPRPSQA
jgi:hypothetical protein